MGYPETGLEFLAYPLQIVSGYQIGFRPEGTATETDARLLLSRVAATTDSVTRIYAGPDPSCASAVVPLIVLAAILTYEVVPPKSVHFYAGARPGAGPRRWAVEALECVPPSHIDRAFAVSSADQGQDRSSARQREKYLTPMAGWHF